MIRICTSCGRKNRIPPAHLADAGRCGACKAELGPLAEPLEVARADFDEIVRGARVPILVDFWAGWCAPCRMVAPEVKRVAHAMAGRALVLKVDTEKHPDLAARFQVTGIPHLVVLRGGRVSFAQSGAVSAAQMQGWLSRAAA